MREELASLMHGIWCGWRCYVVARSTLNSDGTMTTPAWAVKRWGRQINTPYDELSEEEKDSDRKQADKVLALIEKHNDASLEPFTKYEVVWNKNTGIGSLLCAVTEEVL